MEAFYECKDGLIYSQKNYKAAFRIQKLDFMTPDPCASGAKTYSYKAAAYIFSSKDFSRIMKADDIAAMVFDFLGFLS